MHRYRLIQYVGSSEAVENTIKRSLSGTIRINDELSITAVETVELTAAQSAALSIASTIKGTWAVNNIPEKDRL